MRYRHIVQLIAPTILASVLVTGCLGASPGPVNAGGTSASPAARIGIPAGSGVAGMSPAASPRARPPSTRQPATPPTPPAATPTARAALSTRATAPADSTLPVATATTPALPTTPPLTVVRARRGGAVVRAQPRPDAPVLSGLYYDTYLPVYGQTTDAAGVVWDAVRLWGVLPGWIEAGQTATGDPPPPTPTPAGSGGWASGGAAGPSAVYPLASSGVLRDAYNLRAAAGLDGELLATLGPGTAVRVLAWQTDSAGTAWYRVVADGQTGWVLGAGVDLATGARGPTGTGGAAAAIAGKGVWLPLPLLEMAAPPAIARAAQVLGVTHFYVQMGWSGHVSGRSQLDALLPAAHRAGIKVLGWVVTPLDDLTSDVATCTTIAAYRTPDGDRLDGLAPDVELNMNPDDVTAFAQVLRTELGPDYPIVGVIYPAGTWIGQQYPIALPLSRSFDALAPTDYWHDTRRAYTAEEVGSFVSASVADIHRIVGDPAYPVEPIGQAYDSFGRNGAGPNNPTGPEVAAALQAAENSGAVGVSLFQWATTTPAEWDALAAFRWRPG